MPVPPDVDTLLLRAGWVAPMDAPPFRDGGVAVRGGRIWAVGPWAALRRFHPGSAVEDFGAAVLTPGLVNAHVHLELSGLARPAAPAGFVDWLMSVMASAPPPADAGGSDADAVTRAVTAGVRQCLDFGVTTVGDVSRQCAVTRALLRGGPLRVVSYGEVQAMAGRRGLLEARLATAADTSAASDTLRVGVTPHAPYSIEFAGYQRCLAVARGRGLPIATHLAETPDEAAFLADHAGPFRALWDALGAWDNAVPRRPGGPVRLARDAGLLDYPALLAHLNCCDDDELALLAAGRASVVYCPRTHAYFGRPPHRWRDMLARGINVAVGTDSTASAPDLNLLDDLRLLHRLAPEVPSQLLWHLATTRAAAAVASRDEVGSLTPGKYADVVVFPHAGADPLSDVLEREVRPVAVFVGGRRVR